LTQTWDESFLNHDFSKCQQQIIKYFNIRYECLDARDDYSANRKTLQNEGIFPQWATSDLLHSGAKFEVENDGIDAEYDKIGEEGTKVIHQMLEMDNIIKNCGWTDASVDGLPLIDISPVQPEILQNASSWDAAVQVKQQQYLDEKNHHMPSHPTSKENLKLDLFSNNVKITNKSFLQKVFKHEDKIISDVVDSTVHEFNLNADQ